MVEWVAMNSATHPAESGAPEACRRLAFPLAGSAERRIFGLMAKSLQDELAAVSSDLADLSEATRIEWERVTSEGHAWTDSQHNDFVAAFQNSNSRFLQLLDRKRRLVREIRASKAP